MVKKVSIVRIHHRQGVQRYSQPASFAIRFAHVRGEVGRRVGPCERKSTGQSDSGTQRVESEWGHPNARGYPVGFPLMSAAKRSRTNPPMVRAASKAWRAVSAEGQKSVS